MTLFRKKILMLGAFGVGKTSLVRRFVSNEFSEDYVSTLGVRIEKRVVSVEGDEIEMLIWDVAGDDDFVRLRGSYLRGASGVLFVADGTRTWTVDKLVELRSGRRQELDRVPWHALINKHDLPAGVDLTQKLQDHGFAKAVRTSAKTGSNVAETFLALAREVVAT